MRKDEIQISLRTANEQTLERVTVKKVKIDDEVISLDIVRRGQKRFVFEIMRDNGNRMVASSDEHEKAKGAARAGKPIWRRTVKAALKEKLEPIGLSDVEAEYFLRELEFSAPSRK